MAKEIKDDRVSMTTSLESADQLKSVDNKADEGDRKKEEVLNNDARKSKGSYKMGYNSRSNSEPLAEKDKDLIRLDPGAWAVHDSSKQIGDEDEKQADVIMPPMNIRKKTAPGQVPLTLGGSSSTLRRRKERRASEPASKSVRRGQYVALGRA